jgi:hypothetical protein
MRGAIPPLSQYAFMAWCSVKAQGQLYLHLYLTLAISEVVTRFPPISNISNIKVVYSIDLDVDDSIHVQPEASLITCVA